MRGHSGITAQDRAALSAAIAAAGRPLKVVYETSEAGEYAVVQGRAAGDTISFAPHPSGRWGALDLHAEELTTGESIAAILKSHPQVMRYAPPTI